MLRYLIGLAILTVTASSQASSPNNANTDIASRDIKLEFIELFDYELQNRAFAFHSLKSTIEGRSVPAKRAFYKAYLTLEQLNQKHYKPVAEKYQLSIEPRYWTRIRTGLGGVISTVMPETSLKLIHKAALSYIPKLQQLKMIAPKEDQVFFQYVVAQEKVQANAMEVFLQGKEQQAVELFNNFVKNHSSLLPQAKN